MTRFLVSLFAILTFSASAFAVETGFDVGNSFQWQRYEGQVWVHCDDVSVGNQSFYCEDSQMNPVDYARFVTEPGVDANRVELTATWSNGKKVTKKDNFDGLKGQSKGHFNLSIETAFQRRLLGNGLNHVHYKLTQNGALVREGDFEAVVHASGPAKVCDSGTVFESNGSSCRNSFSMCDRYFREAARNCR